MANIIVENDLLTLEQWNDILPTCYYEALEEMLEDMYHTDWEKCKYSANEVLDLLVRYEGGISSGYMIRELVKILYGVDLQ